MATLPPARSRNSSALGLTLIEVLVALAIIAIAMTAVVKAVSENIRSTAYLEDKTSALYVGQQIINEARVGLLKLSDSDGQIEKTEMLGKTWYWQAKESATPNPHIRKIEISVFRSDPEQGDTSAIITLQSYRYKDKDA